MRTHSFRLIAALAVLSVFLFPVAARAQTDTSLKLSTTNATAAAEFRAGVLDYQNISFESAAAHFKAAVDADPKFGLARVLYAGTAFGLDQSQLEAELSRGVADAAHGSNKELILAAAYREAALGHTDVANALFRAASQLMPSDRLVAFASTGGVFSANLAAARDLVTKYPDYPLGYNSLAYLSWNNGDRAGALAAAKRQVELNPTAPNPHDTYAEILQWNGNFADAAAHYKQATTLTPKFPEAYAGLAEVAVLQGQYDQARSYLNQAIANAWTPQQRLTYMRQIVGTYIVQGAPADAVTKALEAESAARQAHHRCSLLSASYSPGEFRQRECCAPITGVGESRGCRRAMERPLLWSYGSWSVEALEPGRAGACRTESSGDDGRWRVEGHARCPRGISTDATGKACRGAADSDGCRHHEYSGDESHRRSPCRAWS